jgi:hypothetical protein
MVSVINLLSIKRFIQMKLAKIKTDESDSKAIREYAFYNLAMYMIAVAGFHYKLLLQDTSAVGTL